ncbi:nuclear pore complex protein NUP98A-like [Lathyrus oleraceus]|uniref:nuclear pore complex protein NUP98A-like n=1 Tax=Pisum sativum TaxID=3888 RepID=UPI0021D171DD|nr:nuclear pore complex protein NUP98A-like [Pisum sativum]XP_050908263.1 nuclear pore complex protein NUP98A-like [Pisum sativum]
MTGFGQTAPSMSTPFQSAQPTQSSGAFSFSNFGQTQPAGASSFGGTPGMFGRNNFGLQPVPQNYVVAQAAPITNPFGTLPALPQMSIGRVGTTPSVQYGISSIPTPARNSIRKEVGSSSGSDTTDTSHSFVDVNHFDNSKIVALEKEKDLNKSSDNDARASVEEKLRQRDAM